MTTAILQVQILFRLSVLELAMYELSADVGRPVRVGTESTRHLSLSSFFFGVG